MDLLGGYGSDSDGSGEEKVDGAKDSGGGTAAPTPAAASGTKRKVVNYARLPMSRPLDLGDSERKGATGGGDEPPLKRAADLESVRLSAGRSLLSALPAPKCTLGSETGLQGGGGVKVDLSGLAKPRLEPPNPEKTRALLTNPDAPLMVAEDGVVPDGAVNHPMFGGGPGSAAAAAVSEGRVEGGPTAEELEELRSIKNFTKISADDMKDPDWYMKNQISGGPGLHKGKSVAQEISMYEGASWKKTTHANPSRVQTRKHQINWLANEAIEKEAEMLDRNAQGRLTKAQTQMKYGW